MYLRARERIHVEYWLPNALIPSHVTASHAPGRIHIGPTHLVRLNQFCGLPLRLRGKFTKEAKNIIEF
eukprot:5320365-Pleurochrysis_carterae.AAC.1